MSTSYPILEFEKTSLSLDEHSNKLDITISSQHQGVCTTCSIEDRTPAEIVQAACAMLTAASYWMDPDEFDLQVFAAFKDYRPGDSFGEALAELRRDLIKREVIK